MGEWTHIAATYDEHNMILYVNGAEVGNLKALGCFTEFSGNLRIGRGFTGLMEKFSIWSTAINCKEINEIIKD